MAEAERFELSKAFTLLPFQGSALDRYATPPCYIIYLILWYNGSMESIIHADIFFFISSIFFILLSILIVMVIFYLRETLQNFRDISRMLKSGVKNAGEHVGEVFEDVEDSAVYKFIFGKKKRGKKK